MTMLDDAGRAAVMIMLLEQDQAAAILSRLDPAELQLLGERMCALGDIGPELITEAISGFVGNSEQHGISSRNRPAEVRTLIERAVGDVKAESMMQRILPDAPPPRPAIELARWLTAEALIPLVKDEHPQALAVLLIQLDASVAADVLHALPPEVQPQVMHRIASLGPVSGEAIEMLDEVLQARIASRHGKVAFQMGGPREAADIINNAGKIIEKRVMPEIVKIDRALAKQIENEMFKFEHLFVLDPQAMGALLREVESETLIDALKGIPEEQRDVFFRAMSSRAADGVRDEISARGRLKLADVVEAQKAIITVARRLAADGTIVMGSSADDEYV